MFKKIYICVKINVGDTMKSRMDRYYQSNETTSRALKNKHLYDDKYDDYDLKSYSNVEGVARIDKNNQIDLDKLQTLLKKREEERQNEIPHLVKINEILNQAKNEKKDDYKTRHLSDTSYNILKNINIKEVQNEDEQLKELIDTVTTTSFVNKLADKDLSLDLLDDLKSDNNTEIISPSDMRDAIKSQNSSYEEKDDETDNLKEIDNSFYTSSLGFTNDDFEQLKDIQKSIKTNNKLIKFLVLILIVAVIAGIIFLIFNLKG